MRVARAEVRGAIRYVRVADDTCVVLAADTTVPTGSLVASGELWRAEVLGSPIPLEEVRLLAPVIHTGKVIGIGLNYVDHASEASQVLPAEPLVFAKFPSSIIGPLDSITFDRSLTDGVDLEAELAVVIGRTARNVSVDEAMAHVGAYTCLNDVSARDLQFADGQWVRGKSLDTFCPIGPWLVRPEDFDPDGRQRIRGWIGHDLLQDAPLSDMVFGVAEVISRLSRSFTLHPGDVIATGTPPGVGWFREPRRVLRDGDVVTIEIEGIGRLENPVRVLD